MKVPREPSCFLTLRDWVVTAFWNLRKLKKHSFDGAISQIWAACIESEEFLPSKRSIVTPSTNISHQRRWFGCRPAQSTTSNLLNFPARYIKATAITSGSHCRDKVVHKLKKKKILLVAQNYTNQHLAISMIRGTAMKTNILLLESLLNKVEHFYTMIASLLHLLSMLN